MLKNVANFKDHLSVKKKETKKVRTLQISSDQNGC